MTGDDELLQALAIEYSSRDKTSSPISAQLAAIVDQSWSATLPDAKLKQKLAEYDRPENCGRLLAPKVNHEIWSRISLIGQRQDLKFVGVQNSNACAAAALAKSTQALLDNKPIFSKDEDNGVAQWKELVTSQIDALALLGNANCQLSQRRREMLKPFLNKEYAALCSSQTAITSLLFGDELQNQLASIRASNHISNTAIQSSSRANMSMRLCRAARPNRTWPAKHNDRDKSFFYKGPNPRWTYKNRQQKSRGGAHNKSEWIPQQS